MSIYSLTNIPHHLAYFNIIICTMLKDGVCLCVGNLEDHQKNNSYQSESAQERKYHK